MNVRTPLLRNFMYNDLRSESSKIIRSSHTVKDFLVIVKPIAGQLRKFRVRERFRKYSSSSSLRAKIQTDPPPKFEIQFVVRTEPQSISPSFIPWVLTPTIIKSPSNPFP